MTMVRSFWQNNNYFNRDIDDNFEQTTNADV